MKPHEYVGSGIWEKLSFNRGQKVSRGGRVHVQLRMLLNGS